ncbi:50S ribosomal protein L13 [Candidatus Wolfebacteria bacterium RIFCSPLOWO2_01_FULL_38_11]|uniref:50S ribosomal protein L13 n=2 Tax=Candidatus Wolfeibacteriota TaxID=1752735 RepID=A0A0G0J2C3_9BACT|nr:MAG: 50S ribosomal protein L13 [Candidatus Wolfebacteria bacterium GW2011_GWC1_37_10]OGM92025.1 MAG: 50S ribosomal protein L13 [Candidatus Wolfebacteria bacterium RIFCSPLOWO2_01_FULL_38_11]
MDYIIDVKGKKLGRLASEIAVILQGKKNPNYDRKSEGDDKVIVKNINDLEISPKKQIQKIYYRHTTQIGHLKEQSLGMLLEKKGPAGVLRKVVREMLPENKLRIRRMKKLIIE